MRFFSRKDNKPKMRGSFADGVTSLVNALVNKRQASQSNAVVSRKLTEAELRTIFRIGIMSRIFRVKTSYALNDTLAFESEEDKLFYKNHFATVVKRAAQFQLGFGRGAILIREKGSDLATPKRGTVPSTTTIRAFSGDLVNSSDVAFDIDSERYYKPVTYSMRGHYVHWTRVVDFTYYEPVEDDLPIYDYGGISESELIYEQLINDQIIERASAHVVEKNSTIFYKVAELKQRLEAKQEQPLIDYFSRLEDMRSIYGAGLLDVSDEVDAVSQTLTNLSEVNDMSLRRLAMITGIPVPLLIGENVRGLNSTGDTERQTFEDMIASYAGDYLIPNINSLMHKFGRGTVEYAGMKEKNPVAEIDREAKVIDNAVKLASIGEDFDSYLIKHGVTQQEEFDFDLGQGDIDG